MVQMVDGIAVFGNHDDKFSWTTRTCSGGRSRAR